MNNPQVGDIWVSTIINKKYLLVELTAEYETHKTFSVFPVGHNDSLLFANFTNDLCGWEFVA